MSKLHLKKSLGQHFLKDEEVLAKITDAIGDMDRFETVIEIGPGMGALTKHLLNKKPRNFFVVELDERWAHYLEQTFPQLKGRIIGEDFLKADLKFMRYPAHVVGNFPYNISSQIIFKILDNRDVVQQMTGMFQKEVGQRIIAPAGTKDYGVISVLTQAWYEGKYLFDVSPDCFEPPPKVVSGVIQLIRRRNKTLNCSEDLFRLVVKTAFNQRRKTLRNSLKGIISDKTALSHEIFELRPERLSVQQFEKLANMIRQ
jgi:16S rRNA (adenine1518-N6/adenine1519-N6)-dimethyltransferase